MLLAAAAGLVRLQVEVAVFVSLPVEALLEFLVLDILLVVLLLQAVLVSTVQLAVLE